MLTAALCWCLGRDVNPVWGQRDIHYRSKWYVKREAEPLIFGVGIHGQFLFVDPTKKLSIAWFGSQDSPLDSPPFEQVLATIEKIRVLVS